MAWVCVYAAARVELQINDGTMNANMNCNILKQSMIHSLGGKHYSNIIRSQKHLGRTLPEGKGAGLHKPSCRPCWAPVGHLYTECGGAQGFHFPPLHAVKLVCESTPASSTPCPRELSEKKWWPHKLLTLWGALTFVASIFATLPWSPYQLSCVDIYRWAGRSDDATRMVISEMYVHVLNLTCMHACVCQWSESLLPPLSDSP